MPFDADTRAYFMTFHMIATSPNYWAAKEKEHIIVVLKSMTHFVMCLFGTLIFSAIFAYRMLPQMKFTSQIFPKNHAIFGYPFSSMKIMENPIF